MITAVLDANVLFPQHVCDLFLSLADAKMFRPIWSDMIHVEWMRNVLELMPNLDPIRIERRRAMMEQTFPDATVSGFEDSIETIQGVHRKDRHVMAAAIAVGAEVIVTFNLKNFTIPVKFVTEYELLTPMISLSI